MVGGGKKSQSPIYPAINTALHAQLSINSPQVVSVAVNAPLSVLDKDLELAESFVGQKRQWFYVQDRQGERSWAPAETKSESF